MSYNSYNIEAIKKKIAQLQGNVKTEKKEQPKFTWFKPQIGKQYDVRFIPLLDGEGNPLSQPFFETAFYDNKELTKFRFPAPSQFGEPDPIKDLVFELAKDRSKEAWLLKKKLTPKERYYAALIVRGGTSDVSGDTKPVSEDTVILWEFTSKICKDVYATLVHPDYVDEDLFDLDTGYDFTVSVNATDKVFEGHPVKEIKLQPRRKASKVADKKTLEKILAQRPNLHDYFKAQIKSQEQIDEMLQAFLASKTEDASVSNENGLAKGGEVDMTAALADIDKQFADLDE